MKKNLEKSTGFLDSTEKKRFVCLQNTIFDVKSSFDVFLKKNPFDATVQSPIQLRMKRAYH